MAKELFTIRIDPELKRSIEKLAKSSGCTVTDVGERCLIAGLGMGQDFVRRLGDPRWRWIMKLVAGTELDEHQLKLFQQVYEATSKPAKGKGAHRRPA